MISLPILEVEKGENIKKQQNWCIVDWELILSVKKKVENALLRQRFESARCYGVTIYKL